MATVSDSIADTIGDTPLIRLKHVTPPGSAQIYLKLESLNPTGSYKDRLARAIIEEAEKQGTLKPGMTVVEWTGGSTGSSLAFICAIKGYKFEVVTSPVFARGKVMTMRAFGSELHLITSQTGRIDAALIDSMREAAAKISSKDGYFYADQFNNPAAIKGYEGIASELLHQLPGGIDGFCAAVGSAGMLAGVSRGLRARWPNVKLVALEPASSPIITKGFSGPHGIDGVGTGKIPAHLTKEVYDEAWAIEEEQARIMCRTLAQQEGLLVGTSTGLNVVAAQLLAQQLGPDKTVVTVACDNGMKYLSTDLFSDS